MASMDMHCTLFVALAYLFDTELPSTTILKHVVKPLSAHSCAMNKYVPLAGAVNTPVVLSYPSS